MDTFQIFVVVDLTIIAAVQLFSFLFGRGYVGRRHP